MHILIAVAAAAFVAGALLGRLAYQDALKLAKAEASKLKAQLERVLRHV